MFAEAPDKQHVIEQLFQGLLEEAVGDAGRQGCFMVNCMVELAPHDPDVQRIAQNHQAEMQFAIADTIRDGQMAGQIGSTQDPKALADFLYNAIIGLRALGKVQPNSSVLENATRITLAALS